MSIFRIQTMRTTVLVLIVLILVSRQTINGLEPGVTLNDIVKVQNALKILCQHPSVKCEKKEVADEYFDFLTVISGRNSAVVMAEFDTEAGTEVFKLTRRSDGSTELEEVKEKIIRVVIKVAFLEITEQERSNAIILADKKIGPKVYEIPVHDHSVPFEEYLILERVDGWTFQELFKSWLDKVDSPKVIYDDVFALTLQRKLLNMHIVYLKRIMDVWKLKYRYCDAHGKNVMMRAVPIRECHNRAQKEGEEGVTFDVIVEGDEAKCVSWKTKYSVLVDPAAMVSLEKAENEKCGWDAERNEPNVVDLYRVFETWHFYKDALIRRLRNASLLKKMNVVIKQVPIALPPHAEKVKGEEIYKGLRHLRKVEQMKTWSANYDRGVQGRTKHDARRKASRGQTRPHSVGGMRAKKPEGLKLRSVDISDHARRISHTRARSLKVKRT